MNKFNISEVLKKVGEITKDVIPDLASYLPGCGPAVSLALSALLAREEANDVQEMQKQIEMLNQKVKENEISIGEVKDILKQKILEYSKEKAQQMFMFGVELYPDDGEVLNETVQEALEDILDEGFETDVDVEAEGLQDVYETVKSFCFTLLGESPEICQEYVCINFSDPDMDEYHAWDEERIQAFVLALNKVLRAETGDSDVIWKYSIF